jgi:DhnA family fructose-bisphosphate aldolase class Ia
VANLQRIYAHGRLGGTGYLSILPVDQGVEHSAGGSFAKNPANCYLGRIGLINSGGASGKTFQGDLSQAVRTAVINKRAGGTGLISGRKAFQHPMPEGVRLLNVIQDVYLDQQITIA